MTQNINKELDDILVNFEIYVVDAYGGGGNGPMLSRKEALAKIQALITLKQQEARIEEIQRCRELFPESSNDLFDAVIILTKLNERLVALSEVEEGQLPK